MKTILLVLCVLFLALGALIMTGDVYVFHRYGVHFGEIAAITDQGDVVAWPTGETPLFAQVSASAYFVVFWTSAVGLYYIRRAIGQPYHGRVWRGTE
jgi:hypothetical protein